MQKPLSAYLVALIASLLILAGSVVPASADPTKTFIAVINGGQETPPNASNAFGVAFLTFNETTNELCFSISYFNLVGGEVAAHVHGPAKAGVNAAIAFALPAGTPKNACVGPLDPSEKRALKQGRLYVNIHTTTFPGGEIRGQVLPIVGAK